MKTEEVMQIINALAEKFGTTAQYLIAEMARYYIVTSAAWVVITGLFVFLLYRLMRLCAERAREDEYSSYEIYIVFVFIALVAACIALGLNVVTLAGWIASPTASVIKEIMTML